MQRRRIVPRELEITAKAQRRLPLWFLKVVGKAARRGKQEKKVECSLQEQMVQM